MAPGDEVFTRRIVAVLVAENEAVPAADAPEAIDVVARALSLLRVAGGDVERLGANAIVAGFEHPTAAVTAANRLHTDAASVAASGWRVGIHAGEVIMTDDGAETRMAIERATALASIARPGTTAVAAGALAAIGSLRDATIEALEVSSDRPEGAVYLIVPSVPRSPSLDRRQLVAGLAGAALAGAGAAAWFARGRFWADGGPRHVTLGVGPFDSSNTDAERAWIGSALRTGLNTQLSQLSGVKVYSHAFLDFHVSREKVSLIEIASRLGIEKMLTGSVLVVGDSIRVEVQVMDVATGLVEGAHATVGRAEDFLALENELVLAVVSALPLRLSPDDERRLAARRAVDPEAFRRFLGTEGAGELPALPPPPGEGGTERPSSFLPGPRAAYADDAPAEVAVVLEAYRRALEAHDLAALEAMYLTFLPAQRSLLEHYFKSVRDLKVRLDDVDVSVIGDEAAVSYTRIDDSIDVATRRPQHLSVRVTRMLRRVDGRWRFASVQ